MSRPATLLAAATAGRAGRLSGDPASPGGGLAPGTPPHRATGNHLVGVAVRASRKPIDHVRDALVANLIVSRRMAEPHWKRTVMHKHGSIGACVTVSRRNPIIRSRQAAPRGGWAAGWPALTSPCNTPGRSIFAGMPSRVSLSALVHLAHPGSRRNSDQTSAEPAATSGCASGSRSDLRNEIVASRLKNPQDQIDIAQPTASA